MSTNPKNVPVAKAPKVNDDAEWQTYKAVGGKTNFGHRLNTLASAMDALIEAGKYTENEIAEKLSAMEFNNGKKTLNRCKQAIKAHLGYLPLNKGVKIEIHPKTRAIRGIVTTEKTK